MRNILHIEEGWTLRFVHPATANQVSLSAAVPGSIAADLMKSGILPDLYKGLNPLLASEWEGTDFTYSIDLQVPPPLAGGNVLLRFDGIDTSAVITIDGAERGRCGNMFIPLEIDLTAEAGRKVLLEVRIECVRSVAERMTGIYGTSPDDFHHMNRPEALVIRKSQHSFGWDIAPRLLFGGIWKQVRFVLAGESFIERDSLRFRTESLSPDRKSAVVSVQGRIVAGPAVNPVVKVRMACADSIAESSVHPVDGQFTARMELHNPRCWWPDGYGTADLYDLLISLTDGRYTLDDHSFRSGIRTISLDRAEDLSDPSRNRFQFTINHEPVFVRGSNWVPVDAIHRPLPEETLRTLVLFSDCRCNMLRVWGGGVYEDDLLYDFCDKNGIMVWQDFMFGCAYYPQSDAFLAEARREAESVVRRLRNHPSLTVWSGDNEGDAAFLWRDPGSLLPSANRLTREVLAGVVTELCGEVPYLASSPLLSDEAVRRKTDTSSPEQHLWGPRGFFKSPYYAENTAVFAGEIGYHGCPAKESLAEFLSPARVWDGTNNREWVLHATEPGGRETVPLAKRNELMIKQAESLFGSTFDRTDIDQFILASQATQAEALKYFVEHFRSRKPAKTGILWWNMRDMWPQFSDSIVDWFGRKKLAYYFLRNCQRPFCLMMREEPGRLVLTLVNDTLTKAAGKWRVYEPDERRLVREGSFAVGPNTCLDLSVFEIPRDLRLWFLSWDDGSGPFLNHYTAGPSPWDFARYREFLWHIERIPRSRLDEPDIGMTPAQP